MRVTDFKIGKARRPYARDAQVFALALRSSSYMLRTEAMAIVKESGEDLAKAERRVAHISSTRFNFNALSEEQCFANFRFRTADVPSSPRSATGKVRLVAAGTSVILLLLLAYFLRRLGYPIRWRDIEEEFGMHFSKMSEIFWEVAHSLYIKKKHLISTYRKDIIDGRAALYAQAVADRGGALINCIGFIDGTKIAMCRPGGADVDERVNYSGHKRKHCLSYQTVTVPDGLILHIHGPTEGRQPDAVMYSRSNMDDILRDNLLIDGKQYCIYGDVAYRLRPWLCTVFPRRTATADQIQFNVSMNGVRTCVEWSYAEVKQSFTSQDFARNLRLKQAPIAQLYICSALLHNFRVCLGYGGMTVQYFMLRAPELDDLTSKAFLDALDFESGHPVWMVEARGDCRSPRQQQAALPPSSGASYALKLF
eukprot:IDg8826t1